MEKNVFAVLMAGGVGSRFWPVSTAKHPKQFRDLLGSGETLIQTTFRRLKKFIPAENIYILTNESYIELVMEQLPEVTSEQVVGEPVMRNTAPAVLLAAFKIKKRRENAIMIMAPSDHWIENEEAFVEDIHTAVKSCRKGDKIVTLGIQPDFPNTGYGYIRYNKSAEEVKKVKNFTEKPSFEMARNFLASGDYLWNAGIFIWNIPFLLKSFEKNLPEMYGIFEQGGELYNSPEEPAFIKNEYPRVQDISIDYGILEKEEKVFVIPASFDWNDLGTWGSVYSEVEKDEHENAVLNAKVLLENSSGNIISAGSNKVIVVEGLTDYIIVDEKDVLLIIPRKKEQEIKLIRGQVQEKYGSDRG